MLFLGSKENAIKKAARITKEEEIWQIEKENLERQNKIQDEYNQLTTTNESHLSMSKKALIFLLISCSCIEIFTIWVTIRSISLAFAIGIMPDFTPLVTLIGTVVGEVVALAAYYAKSAKENTSGGITYESAAARNFDYTWGQDAQG